MKFLIVTGLSGAGKTSVLRHLEDSGYQCIDNLPPMLLPQAFTLCEKVALTKPVALGVDSRSGALFDPHALLEAIDGGAAAGTGGSGDAAGSTGAAYSGGRAAGARQIFVAGGDYFSQSQYNSVKKSGDDLFARFAVSSRPEGSHEGGELPDEEQFYTETLAGIYVEQGYLAEAKKIYSKLSLRYPEKSIYFANLIDEINKN